MVKKENNTKLITLVDGVLLVNGYAKPGDCAYDTLFSEIIKVLGNTRIVTSNPTRFLKIIATNNPKYNLPTIDYDGLEEKYGIIDIDQLVEDYIEECWLSGEGYDTEDIEAVKITAKYFIEKSNKNKKYTEDDLRKAMNFGKFGVYNGITTTTEFIHSLQKNEWDVEVELDERKQITSSDKGFLEDNPNYMKPLINNNKIKILK